MKAWTVFLLPGFGCRSLIGQPPSYWHDPKTANEAEPIVRFLMVRGYMAFVVGGLRYVITTIVVVSVAPRRVGMVILLTLLLAHFWGVASWLVSV